MNKSKKKEEKMSETGLTDADGSNLDSVEDESERDVLDPRRPSATASSEKRERDRRAAGGLGVGRGWLSRAGGQQVGVSREWRLSVGVGGRVAGSDSKVFLREAALQQKGAVEGLG